MNEKGGGGGSISSRKNRGRKGGVGGGGADGGVTNLVPSSIHIFEGESNKDRKCTRKGGRRRELTGF
jgi:hypothetical protein